MSPHAPPLHGSLALQAAALPESTPPLAVPPCAGRPGAAAIGPLGADLPWGGPAAGRVSSAPTIAIQVNGEAQTTTAPTLHDWVLAQDATPESLATAVNGQFVPRTARADTVLREGDHILTFQPITGG